jgi:hypothetical protein
MCHMPRLQHSLDLICLMIFGDEYKTWSSLLWNFLHSPVTSSLLVPNTVLFSNTLCLCTSLSLRDQVSHSYKTTGRIMVLFMFNLYIPGQQVGRQETLNRMVASIPRINPLLISSCMQFWSINNWTLPHFQKTHSHSAHNYFAYWWWWWWWW